MLLSARRTAESIIYSSLCNSPMNHNIDNPETEVLRKAKKKKKKTHGRHVVNK